MDKKLIKAAYILGYYNSMSTIIKRAAKETNVKRLLREYINPTEKDSITPIEVLRAVRKHVSPRGEKYQDLVNQYSRLLQAVHSAQDVLPTGAGFIAKETLKNMGRLPVDVIKKLITLVSGK